MKLNHFCCPSCEHDFFDSAAYSTCDACGMHFYASQSKTCKRNVRYVPYNPYGLPGAAGSIGIPLDQSIGGCAPGGVTYQPSFQASVCAGMPQVTIVASGGVLQQQPDCRGHLLLSHALDVSKLPVMVKTTAG